MSPSVMSSSFELTVKSPDRLTYTVRVSPEWTIKEVKEEVARVSNTPNLDIVFCGQRLENDKKLKVRPLWRLSVISPRFNKKYR